VTVPRYKVPKWADPATVVGRVGARRTIHQVPGKGPPVPRGTVGYVEDWDRISLDAPAHYFVDFGPPWGVVLADDEDIGFV